jgi:class 3 adenylate cyclase/tetratricopeptide (TPR) repeat protein
VIESVQERLSQYIPPELLSKLESARASGGMMGERRVVTMLFCDVQGSTQAAEQLDPEEWADIMNGAFSRLIEPVYKYEGTLARLMGDAILAFFGAPIGHEDDPQRAALAALDILQDVEPYRAEVKSKWGIDFNVRIGINTGLVVVGEVGSDLRVEYTALGDAVNLAARMEQTAEPGTIQVSSDTHRLIAPLFDFEPLGGIEVRGKADPVDTFMVLGAKAAPGSLRGIEGLDSPLIGRDADLKSLRETVSQLMMGNGQMVSIMGEAGLGKSRLLAELRRALVTDGHVALRQGSSSEATSGGMESKLGWYEGRSYSYETSTPYAPFIVLFKNLFGIQPGQSDAEQYELIHARASTIAPGRANDLAPFMANMLGVQTEGEAAQALRYLDPPQMRQNIFNATMELLEKAAAERPQVIVLDDLHWVDPTSLDLVRELMPITDRAALMIISVFRPSTQDASWQFHESAMRDYGHRYHSVTLQPLSADDSRELVANLLEVEDLPERVRALILEKSEGNPFFVEEVIRSLLDANLVERHEGHWRATQDIERIAVPDTLAGVITARLDRLDDTSKRVAQTSSIIGREFQYEALESIFDDTAPLEEALMDLQRRELIREKTRFPQRTFIFKHAVTQETAYGSLLLSNRRQLHDRMAEFLVSNEAERVNEIARHFVEARQSAKALPYMVTAGDNASRNYSTQEAIDFYTQSLDILENEKNSALARKAYEGLAGALTFEFDVPGAVNAYHKMIHEAEDYNDMPMKVSALNKLAFVTGAMQGQYPEAESHLGDAEGIARDCNDLEGLAEMHMNYCALRIPFGEFEDAHEHLTEAAELGETLDLEEPRLFGLAHISTAKVCMTEFDEAWESANEALEVARKFGNRQYESEVLAMPVPFCLLREGKFDQASEAATKAHQIGSQIGAAGGESTAAYVMAEISMMRGEYERAIDWATNAVDVANGAGMFFISAAALSAAGMAHLEISSDFVDKTVEVHQEAIRLMDMPFGTAYGGMIWAELGFCALALGQTDMASELFQKGLNVSNAAQLMAKPMHLVGSSFLSMGQGNMEDAASGIAEAREFVDERKMKHLDPIIAFAEANLAGALGEAERALERFAHAEERASMMKMRPWVWQSRAGAAQILAGAGRTEEATMKLDQARETVDEIAGLFKDDNLRQKYLDSMEAKLATP